MLILTKPTCALMHFQLTVKGDYNRFTKVNSCLLSPPLLTSNKVYYILISTLVLVQIFKKISLEDMLLLTF